MTYGRYRNYGQAIFARRCNHYALLPSSLLHDAVPLWPGVYEGWLLRDDRASPHWIPVARISRRIFSGLSSVMELHRVQFHVHSLDTRAIKYAKFLMFQEEGTLTNYGPNKADFLMMRRLY